VNGTPTSGFAVSWQQKEPRLRQDSCNHKAGIKGLESRSNYLVQEHQHHPLASPTRDQQSHSDLDIQQWDMLPIETSYPHYRISMIIDWINERLVIGLWNHHSHSRWKYDENCRDDLS
jgi:hypothetical protein